MSTRGFDYGYDARSYAPLMLFSLATLAFWMWLPGVSGPRRRWLYAGLTLALAGAVSSNYYGVLAILPVAGGELSQIHFSGRIRPGVWLAMALGMLPLFWYLPLIRHNLAEFGPHAWNPPQAGMVGASYLELVEAIFWPVLLLTGYALYKRLLGPSILRPEFIALAVLLAYPVIGYCFAWAGSAMISPRCVTPVCCGFGLAAGVLSQRVFGRSTQAGLVVIMFLVAWVAVREAVCLELLLNQRRAFFSLRDDVQRHAGRRIVLADSAFALPLFFYSNRKVQAQMVFPIDFAAIHRYAAEDSGEQNLWAGRNGVFPFPVVPFSTLLPLQAEDLLLARPDGGLAHDIQAAGGRVAVLPSRAEPMWNHLGGVFTPMGHAETRELRIVSPR